MRPYLPLVVLLALAWIAIGTRAGELVTELQLLVIAIGLLVASYTARHQARRHLVFHRDRPAARSER